MTVWIITITNANPGSFAFSATKDGVDQGFYTQFNPDPSFIELNISTNPGRNPQPDFALAYNQLGTVGSTVNGSIFWVKDGNFPGEFPTAGQGFKGRDCIILINESKNLALSTGTFSDQGYTIQTKDGVLGNDMIFSVIPNNGIPRFTDKPCCVHPDTMVLTIYGEKMIKDLRKGDTVIDVNNKEVTLECNAKGVTSKKFVNIPMSSLAENVPNQDLLIKEEHPILFEGKQTTPQRLMKKNAGYQLSNVVLNKAEHVYTLCTKKPNFVMMNNVPVGTWGIQEWTKHQEANPDLFWISL